MCVRNHGMTKLYSSHCMSKRPGRAHTYGAYRNAKCQKHWFLFKWASQAYTLFSTEVILSVEYTFSWAFMHTKAIYLQGLLCLSMFWLSYLGLPLSSEPGWNTPFQMLPQKTRIETQGIFRHHASTSRAVRIEKQLAERMPAVLVTHSACVLLTTAIKSLEEKKKKRSTSLYQLFLLN